MAFNGAFFGRGRGGYRGGYRGNNYNPNHHSQQQNNQNIQVNTQKHGGPHRGGYQNPGFQQTFAASVDHSRKRSFSQAEISFIKKITNTTEKPKNTQIHQKKPKTEQNSDEKPPLSITFIGNLDQPFQLNDPKNKQYLRTKLEHAAPQWTIYVQFIHLVINNNQDLKTAQKTIKALPDIEKNTPIGVLVFLPGEDTVVAAFSEFIVEVLKKVTPITTVGTLTLVDTDLYSKSDDDVNTYQAYMLSLYSMFMMKCPRANIINLMQPAEYRPKTKTSSFLDRMAGRIKPLIPDAKSYKTVVNEKAAKAANGVIDFGNAEQQQAFKNLGAKTQASTATYLRSQSQSK